MILRDFGFVPCEPKKRLDPQAYRIHASVKALDLQCPTDFVDLDACGRQKYSPNLRKLHLNDIEILESTFPTTRRSISHPWIHTFIKPECIMVGEKIHITSFSLDRFGGNVVEILQRWYVMITPPWARLRGGKIKFWYPWTLEKWGEIGWVSLYPFYHCRISLAPPPHRYLKNTLWI